MTCIPETGNNTVPSLDTNCDPASDGMRLRVLKEETTDTQRHGGFQKHHARGGSQTHLATSCVVPVTSLAGKSESIWAENRGVFSRGSEWTAKEHERTSGEGREGSCLVCGRGYATVSFCETPLAAHCKRGHWIVCKL